MERRMKDKGFEFEEEGIVQRTQRDSKEEKEGMRILDTLKEDL
jgi:hypothetical protein